MADGRSRRLWEHTATIAAAALSAFRTKPVEPAALNPYTRKDRGRGQGGRGIPVTRENIGVLRALIPPQQRRKATP